MKLIFKTLPTHLHINYRAADVLSFLALIGVLTGALFGSFAVLPVLQIGATEEISASTFVGNFNGAVIFLVLLCLASTSLLGVFLVPALVVVKTYFMSCSVAAFYASCGLSGLGQAFFAHALPSLLFFPSFFLCSQHAMASAARLCALRFHARAYENVSTPFFKTILFTAVSLVLFALYDHFLMPVALAKLF